MEIVNIKTIIDFGIPNEDWSSCTKEQFVLRYGKPDEVEIYEGQEKYYHYDNIRFSLNNNEVETCTIFFYNYRDKKYTYDLIDEQFVISKSIPLHQIFYILNEQNIEWSINYKLSNLDYLIIEIKTGVKIYYYLVDGSLERINVPNRLASS